MNKFINTKLIYLLMILIMSIVAMGISLICTYNKFMFITKSNTIAAKYYYAKAAAMQHRADIQQAQLAKVNKELKELSALYNEIQVTLTAYNPEVAQCDDDPLITASMTHVKAGGVAVSVDLFKQGYTFGRKIYIKNYGMYVITDLMNPRFTKSIDIFMWDKEKAMKFGRRIGRISLTNMYKEEENENI